MKYMLFDAEGLFVGRYDDYINDEIPSGAVEVTDEVFFESISATDFTYKLVNQEVVREKTVEVAYQKSNEEIEIARLMEYAHPVTGSDRYFSEATALQAEGFTATSAEVKKAKAAGLARKLEIKALYPYSN